MSKRKLLTYGKHDKHSQPKRTNVQQFIDLTKDDDVSSSPPTKKSLRTWSCTTAPGTHETTTSSTMEPSAENVDMLLAMGLCDADTARRYLKAKNNNVEQAADALLNGEDISVTNTPLAWDDSVWSDDREGGKSTADGSLHPLAASTAPTRGPSPAGSYRRPGTKAEEDEDLAAAMQMSQGDIRYGQQETGVLRPDGTSVPVQGPQLPDRYANASQWALVKADATTSEIIPDVDAVGRRHVPPEPRFLKNTVHGDYLPNFLTICHNIPAARELLLMNAYTRYDYGQNPDWWKGQPIHLPKVVHISDGSPTDPVLAKYDDFLAELQRIMAFLDLSNRAYASTANLEATTGLARHGKTAKSSRLTNVQTFVEELVAAAHSVNQSGEAVEDMFGLQAGSDDGAIDGRISTIFDFDVESPGDTNLSELLDKTLWDTEADDETPDDRYVERLPEIMVMRLRRHEKDATSLRVKAPNLLHMDKYLKRNVDTVRPLRAQIAQARQRITKIASVEAKLKSWRTSRHSPPTSTVETKTLLAQTKAQMIQIRHDSTDQMMDNDATEIDNHELSAKLDSIIQSIEAKLTVLEDERMKANTMLADLAAPTHAESLLGPLEHRYTLVGIATKPNTTYVLRPKTGAATQNMDVDDQDDDTPATMEWWRIEYSLNGTKASINRNRTYGYETLPAVEHEHTTALLVYASDDALDLRQVTDHNIAEPLEQFVKADNLLFEQELTELPPPSYSFDDHSSGIAMQTIERKASMDSLRAEGGGSEFEYETDPRTHASFNLGYGAVTEYEDQPLAEIPPPTGDNGSNESVIEITDDEKPQSWNVESQANMNTKW